MKNKKLTDAIYEHVIASHRSEAYKRSYRNVAMHIANFEKKYGITLYSDSFNENVSSEFVHYLKTSARRKGKAHAGLMLGTVRTVWDKICFILKKSQRAGCDINVGFEQVKIEKEDADAVYLTTEELGRIEKLVVSQIH